jgi:pyruvate/2-oxoglutarate dehydrogenase complex dihydrolipoamide dehydrogenase (E3) component
VPVWKYKANYDVIPWVTFTDPEIAQVGHNEMSAKKAGISYEVTKYELDGLDRAITESSNRGFVKILTPKGKDKILGATIVGPYAGELLTEFVTAMKAKKGLGTILGTIHSYPTLSEANKFAAGNWKKANKPEGILKWVEKMHRMRL